MAQEQKRRRRKSQEEHYLCFRNPEEVIAWCAGKCPGGKLDKFHTDKIRGYYTDIKDQEELDEALGWLTEHLLGDNSVTLKATLPSGQILSAKSYEPKNKGWRG